MTEPMKDVLLPDSVEGGPIASSNIRNGKGSHSVHGPSLLPPVVCGRALNELMESTSNKEQESALQRMALLGGDILRTCFTIVMYKATPAINPRLICTRRDELMQEKLLAHWTDYYDVRSILGIHTDQEKVDVPWLATIFKIYITTLYDQKAFDSVREWVEVLVHDPKTESILTALQSRSAQEGDNDQKRDGEGAPPRKRLRDEREDAASSPEPADPTFFDLRAPFIPVPPTTPPDLPTGPGYSSIITNPQTSQQTLILQGGSYLYHLNTIAIQQRKKITWKMASIGPPHMLEWHASLAIDDTTMGSGKGNSKQIAKEAAARQACYSLGWAVRTG